MVRTNTTCGACDEEVQRGEKAIECGACIFIVNKNRKFSFSFP